MIIFTQFFRSKHEQTDSSEDRYKSGVIKHRNKRSSRLRRSDNNNNDNDDSSSWPVGAIFAVMIGNIVLIVFLIWLCYFCSKQMEKSQTCKRTICCLPETPPASEKWSNSAQMFMISSSEDVRLEDEDPESGRNSGKRKQYKSRTFQRASTAQRKTWGQIVNRVIMKNREEGGSNQCESEAEKKLRAITELLLAQKAREGNASMKRRNSRSCDGSMIFREMPTMGNSMIFAPGSACGRRENLANGLNPVARAHSDSKLCYDDISSTGSDGESLRITSAGSSISASTVQSDVRMVQNNRPLVIPTVRINGCYDVIVGDDCETSQKGQEKIHSQKSFHDNIRDDITDNDSGIMSQSQYSTSGSHATLTSMSSDPQGSTHSVHLESRSNTPRPGQCRGRSNSPRPTEHGIRKNTPRQRQHSGRSNTPRPGECDTNVENRSSTPRPLSRHGSGTSRTTISVGIGENNKKEMKFLAVPSNF